MRDTFDFYEDPGHGWLKVTKKEIEELGIGQDISGYSYVNNNSVFLEEDGDASLFIKAYERKFGKRPKFEEHVSDRMSKIRDYKSYEV